MSSRRDFIKSVLLGGAFIGLNSSPFRLLAGNELIKITILHTNDTHSRIEPFPMTDLKYPGLGGFARRAALIKGIRKKEKNVMLFDAGDIFQGSPYFNFYGGELEIKLMNEMSYDAATLGNHEFDNGLKGLLKQLPNANFPFISSNYDFSNTELNGKTKPYLIINKDELKIGVFGLGIELKGLVDSKNYGNTVYLNPYEKAAEYAHQLKKENKCDIVICLSHMGYSSNNKQPCDYDMAKQSKNIDLIIGGHSHTLLKKPVKMFNSDGKIVYIGQVGWGGAYLGRFDIYVDKATRKKFVENNTIKIFNNQV
jgi:5'-nucleotidase